MRTFTDIATYINERRASTAAQAAALADNCILNNSSWQSSAQDGSGRGNNPAPVGVLSGRPAENT